MPIVRNRLLQWIFRAKSLIGKGVENYLLSSGGNYLSMRLATA